MVRDIMLNMTAAGEFTVLPYLPIEKPARKKADRTDRPARIDMMRWKMPYGIQEAVEAYKRVAAQHVSSFFRKSTEVYKLGGREELGEVSESVRDSNEIVRDVADLLSNGKCPRTLTR
jgi:hypothetical protein